MRFILLFLLFFQLNFIASAQIQLLNDEFKNAATLDANWLNINETEAWNAEQLEVHDINSTMSDHLIMMPYTSSWFQDYRGTLIHKLVDQNFVFTINVTATDRSGLNMPGAQYSLSGVMIRAARDYPNGALGAGGWTAGGENYIFLAAGFASENHPSCPSCVGPHFEVKNTINSASTLHVSSIATANEVKIRLARLDDIIIVLYQLPGQNWLVHRRYMRSDFPSEMQVGFVTYTDWQKVNTYTPSFQNSHVLNEDLSPDPNAGSNVPFNPALIASFDYGRFDDVSLPTALQGANLMNETQVTDADLLSFLGYNCAAHCPNMFHIYDPIDNGQIVETQAAQLISADNLIETGANALYRAGNCVELQAGFEVGANTEFEVEINGCSF